MVKALQFARHLSGKTQVVFDNQNAHSASFPFQKTPKNASQF
jgi:hypothetical protein